MSLDWHQALREFIEKSREISKPKGDNFSVTPDLSGRFETYKIEEVECTCDVKLLFDQGCQCAYAEMKRLKKQKT